MQLPRKIQVGGLDFKLAQVPLDGETFACVDFEGRTIYFDPILHSDLAHARSTLRHEIHHLSQMVSGQYWASKVDQEVLTRVVENIYDPAVDRLDKQLARLNPPE